MPRLLLMAVISVFLLATPVVAGDLEALFSEDSPLLAVDDLRTPMMNRSFLGANASLKARQALKKPTPHHLVVNGGEVTTDPRDVTINGLTFKPGAEIPPSLRSVTIIGGETRNVVISGGRNRR